MLLVCKIRLMLITEYRSASSNWSPLKHGHTKRHVRNEHLFPSSNEHNQNITYLYIPGLQESWLGSVSDRPSISSKNSTLSKTTIYIEPPTITKHHINKTSVPQDSNSNQIQHRTIIAYQTQSLRRNKYADLTEHPSERANTKPIPSSSGQLNYHLLPHVRHRSFTSLPPRQRQWETATLTRGRWLDGFCRTHGR